MNQRRQPRFLVNQPVEVIELRPAASGMQGTVRNVCGAGVGLQLPAPIPAGAAIRINVEDAFFFGEVIYCREQKKNWQVGVELEQALCGLAELAAALEEFREGPLGGEHSDAVKHTQRKHRQ